MTASAYDDFLSKKAIAAPSVGFACSELNAKAFPHQRAIVEWALAKGRSGVFADTGLGKSLMQLEWAHRVALHTAGRVLILAPLAVAGQTVREGETFGIACVYARTPEEAGDAQIVITNYERLESFLGIAWAGVVLDESSILKAYDGKMRTQIIEAFRRTPFRLACTATPAPNDFMELGNHAEFLGVMKREEMLATFFTHDGGDTSKWRLKGHAEKTFWQWMCTWAVMVRKPSDLGFDNVGYSLPALVFHEHVVKAQHSTAHAAGLLFKQEARTLQERRDARRASIGERVQLAADIVAREPDERWILWCHLNAEADALTAAIPGAVQVTGSDDADVKAERLLAFGAGDIRVMVTKPSIAAWGLNWQRCARVLFVGLSDSYEELYQAVRRCWRFGQTRAVDVHVVISELEGAVLANIRRKEADAERMAAAMVENMRELQGATATKRNTNDYKPAAEFLTPAWLWGNQ
jgi:hypothetical protein